MVDCLTWLNGYHGFCHASLRHSNLFRNSDFGFRILTRMCSVNAIVHSVVAARSSGTHG